MSQEVAETLTAWFAREDYGINALLPGVPRRTIGVTEDAQPGDVGAIYDAYVHDWILRDQEPPIVPSVAVLCEAPLEAVLASAMRGSDGLAAGILQTDGVVVGVTYAARDVVSPIALRNAAYVLRATQRSLLALVNLGTQAERTTRGVCITNLQRIVTQPLAKALGRGSLAGLLLATVQTIDDDLT